MWLGIEHISKSDTFLGVVGLVVGQPLDTVKVRQQTMNTSFLKAITRTFKHEGLRGFYKGMLFPLLTMGPINALFFGVYGNVIRYLQHRPSNDETRFDRNDPNWKAHLFIAGTYYERLSV